MPNALVSNKWCFEKFLQGRNFGLKSGVSIQKENEASWGERRRMGRKYPLLIWLLGLGERQELSQRGPARSHDRKWFYCDLNSADRLCRQQVTHQILHLFVLKSGCTVPLSSISGAGTPRTPVNYAYEFLTRIQRNSHADCLKRRTEWPRWCLCWSDSRVGRCTRCTWAVRGPCRCWRTGTVCLYCWTWWVRSRSHTARLARTPSSLDRTFSS